jgi:hypothetical protein
MAPIRAKPHDVWPQYSETGCRIRDKRRPNVQIDGHMPSASKATLKL